MRSWICELLQGRGAEGGEQPESWFKVYIRGSEVKVSSAWGNPIHSCLFTSYWGSHSSKDALKPLRQQIDSNLVLMRQLYLLRSIGISRNEDKRCMQCSNPQCSLTRMNLERLPTIVLYLPDSEYICNPTQPMTPSFYLFSLCWCHCSVSPHYMSFISMSHLTCCSPHHTLFPQLWSGSNCVIFQTKRPDKVVLWPSQCCSNRTVLCL